MLISFYQVDRIKGRTRVPHQFVGQNLSSSSSENEDNDVCLESNPNYNTCICVFSQQGETAKNGLPLFTKTVKTSTTRQANLPSSTNHSSTGPDKNDQSHTDGDIEMNVKSNTNQSDSDGDDEDGSKRRHMEDIISNSEREDSETESDSNVESKHQMEEPPCEHSDYGHQQESTGSVPMDVQQEEAPEDILASTNPPGVESDCNDQDPKNPSPTSKPQTETTKTIENKEKENDDDIEIIDTPEDVIILVSAFTDVVPDVTDGGINKPWCDYLAVDQHSCVKDLLDDSRKKSGIKFSNVISKENGILPNDANICEEVREVNICEGTRRSLILENTWDCRSDLFLVTKTVC